MFGNNKNDIRFSLIEKKLDKIGQAIIELEKKITLEEKGMVVLKEQLEDFKKLVSKDEKKVDKQVVTIKKGRKPKA